MSQYALAQGDVAAVLAGFRENSFDALMCDPPYFLEFMGKAWDRAASDLPVSEVIFRSWLAGLIAGEGYFRIQEHAGRYACAFGLHMRADEAPLLRALHKRTGLGSIKEEPAVTDAIVKSAPSVRWEIQSKSDCLGLAKLLDGVPLYAKKQREYDVWRRFLAAWDSTPRGNRWNGPSDKSELAALFAEMKTLRPFDEDLAESLFDPFGGGMYDMHFRWARECFRVLKPGAPFVAFSGTRTYHRLVTAVEDAGFEIRDALLWLYGKGFPKSLDLGKAVGAEWHGYGTALKPAHEPIVLARKPLDGTVAANVARWGVGGLAIDACRIGETKDVPSSAAKDRPVQFTKGAEKGRTVDTSGFDPNVGRWPANLILDEDAAALLDAEAGDRPSVPFRANTAEGAVLPMRTRTAGGYADGGGPSRFFKVTECDDSRFHYSSKVSTKEREAGCEGLVLRSAGEVTEREDNTAGLDNPRAGAGRTGGARNHHPTLKPLSLTKWLASLLLPPRPDAVILVPFAGAGSEMIGALQAGWGGVFGIEREAEYIEIAKARLRHWVPEGREAA